MRAILASKIYDRGTTKSMHKMMKRRDEAHHVREVRVGAWARNDGPAEKRKGQGQGDIQQNPRDVFTVPETQSV